jgi:hypothetical protein
MWEVKTPDFSDSSKGIENGKCFLDLTELPMEIYERLFLCLFEGVECRESSAVANICDEECLDGC